MEGKLNLPTISDTGYIWGKMKQDHHDKNKDILGKQLLNDKGYSYSTIQSYINFSQACESYTRILVSTDCYSEWKKFLTISCNLDVLQYYNFHNFSYCEKYVALNLTSTQMKEI